MQSCISSKPLIILAPASIHSPTFNQIKSSGTDAVICVMAGAKQSLENLLTDGLVRLSHMEVSPIEVSLQHNDGEGNASLCRAHPAWQYI